MAENLLYPVFLKLEGRKVLVIGGGFVAFQKLTSLIQTKAKLTVIAPNIINEIRELDGEFPNKRYIDFIERDYNWGDEKDAFMVIAATNIPELNLSILNRCKDQLILASSVDHTEESDFFVPSIACQSDIKIAISTNGKAPGLAQGLRKLIQNNFLTHYAKRVPLVYSFRERIKEKYSDNKKRNKLIRQFTQRQLRRIESELNLAK
jgi:siroheme synthase-like protein